MLSYRGLQLNLKNKDKKLRDDEGDEASQKRRRPAAWSLLNDLARGREVLDRRDAAGPEARTGQRRARRGLRLAHHVGDRRRTGTLAERDHLVGRSALAVSRDEHEELIAGPESRTLQQS